MPLKERVYSVLVVSASEKINSFLTSLLSENDYFPVHIVSSVSQAQRSILEQHYDLVIINSPLPDDFGKKFAIDACRNSAAVMLMVRNDIYEDVYDEVVDFGVFTMRKPTPVQVVTQSLDYMCAMRERLRRLEKKAISLEDKMAEIRIVNRAKWVLIDSCKMTEADAHRFIEKQAMDRCLTRKEVAEAVLKTYKPK